MPVNTQTAKYIMVIDETLPLGLIANTAAVLGIALGKNLPAMVGPSVCDGQGGVHAGLTRYPVAILRGTRKDIAALRQKLNMPVYNTLASADFSHIAQRCKNYEEYTERMAQTDGEALEYLGLALWGDKKLINKLTGSMPLLR